MSTVISTWLFRINGYKTYVCVILTVAMGIAVILAKNNSQVTTDIFQALFVVFSGASVASLRHAVGKEMPKS
jgi:hypothetical protein